MTLLIVLSVAVGVLLGHFLLPAAFIAGLDGFISTALGILLLGIGIELGASKQLWQDLRKVGIKIVWVPLAVAVGSLAGAVVVGLFLNLPINESSAIGAGFGWYSLSGVLLSQIYQVETGALAFLTNVFRELLALISIPLMAKYASFLTAVAPGGATTMDVTLPLIARATNERTTLIAFITGVVLTGLVPVLVPLLIAL